MLVKTFKIADQLIGARIEVPVHISENRNIVNPETVNNLCFWTCYAYHLTKKHKCIKLAKELFEQFYHKKQTADYDGIDIDGSELEKFEIILILV